MLSLSKILRGVTTEKFDFLKTSDSCAYDLTKILIALLDRALALCRFASKSYSENVFWTFIFLRFWRKKKMNVRR
jgi:hypothetical protein